MTITILFDINGFADLVQQPAGLVHLHKLKQLVKNEKLTVVGCCTMLRELAGLAKTNTQLYLDTLSEYAQVTLGQILKPSNELTIAEGQQLKPITFQTSLLDKASARNILDNLRVPSNADAISSEALGQKQGYGLTMETARQEVLSTDFINEPLSSILAGYKDWFKHFDVIIQRWFVDMFKVKSDFPVAQLPHVSAFLGYLLTRIYESTVLNIKNRDNDLFDRAYFTDAAVVDILITNDISFGRTALRIPNRTLEVLKLNELASLIDKWNIT
jgi:hypothetical protein